MKPTFKRIFSFNHRCGSFRIFVYFFLFSRRILAFPAGLLCHSRWYSRLCSAFRVALSISLPLSLSCHALVLAFFLLLRFKLASCLFSISLAFESGFFLHSLKYTLQFAHLFNATSSPQYLRVPKSPSTPQRLQIITPTLYHLPMARKLATTYSCARRELILCARAQELTQRTGKNPAYTYLSLGCSKAAADRMLHFARAQVGKPFSNAGMARAIVWPRITVGDSWFCAGTLLATFSPLSLSFNRVLTHSSPRAQNSSPPFSKREGS